MLFITFFIEVFFIKKPKTKNNKMLYKTFLIGNKKKLFLKRVKNTKFLPDKLQLNYCNILHFFLMKRIRCFFNVFIKTLFLKNSMNKKLQNNETFRMNQRMYFVLISSHVIT